MCEKDDRNRNSRLKILLTTISVIAIVLAGLNIYQYELQKANSPVQPIANQQKVNTSLLNSILAPGNSVGVPLTLTWPALLTGKIASNTSIYFFITFEYNGIVQVGTNASHLTEISSFIVGPQKIINVSVELPPGKWWLNLYESNTVAKVNASNFTITYKFYTPKTSTS